MSLHSSTRIFRGIVSFSPGPPPPHTGLPEESHPHRISLFQLLLQTLHQRPLHLFSRSGVLSAGSQASLSDYKFSCLPRLHDFTHLQEAHVFQTYIGYLTCGPRSTPTSPISYLTFPFGCPTACQTSPASTGPSLREQLPLHQLLRQKPGRPASFFLPHPPNPIHHQDLLILRQKISQIPPIYLPSHHSTASHQTFSPLSLLLLLVLKSLMTSPGT